MTGESILIVDDTLENVNVLTSILEMEGYRIRVATSGERALAVIKLNKPDMILLDVMMPGIDGFETCRRLKSDAEVKDIPVIFITAKIDVDSLKTGFEMGAVDYVNKPIRREEVLARVNVHLENQALIRYRSELIDKLEEALKIKDLFFANMSHEIRTPLSAIVGFSELLYEDVDNDAAKDDASKILSSGQYLLQMINDILDISKIEAEKMILNIETIVVRDLINDVTEMIRPLAERKSNQLEIHLADNIDIIRNDCIRLKQILINFLSNACKFTENGTVKLTITKELNQLVFMVCDDGIGMTKEEVKQLFQPYTQANKTTSSNYGGTGLGLVLCKKFCTLMGGKIYVDSEVGKGSCFILNMPLTSSPT